VFWSTKYLRHPSDPLYTPEQGVTMRSSGHANQLAGPGYADMYDWWARGVGRSRTEDAMRFLSQRLLVHDEFGVVGAARRVRAFGAAFFHRSARRPLPRETYGPVDMLARGGTEYDTPISNRVLYGWRRRGTGGPAQPFFASYASHAEQSFCARRIVKRRTRGST